MRSVFIFLPDVVGSADYGYAAVLEMRQERSIVKLDGYVPSKVLLTQPACVTVKLLTTCKKDVK